MNGPTVISAFDKVASKRGKRRKEPLKPVSFRFTADELALLRRKAGNQSLSAYVRESLLGEAVTPRKARHQRKQRRPDLDHETLARLLGMLGKSELGRSMIALAMAARSGALPVEPETVEQIEGACANIQEMRTALIVALRIKPPPSSEDGR